MHTARGVDAKRQHEIQREDPVWLGHRRIGQAWLSIRYPRNEEPTERQRGNLSAMALSAGELPSSRDVSLAPHHRKATFLAALSFLSGASREVGGSATGDYGGINRPHPGPASEQYFIPLE